MYIAGIGTLEEHQPIAYLTDPSDETFCEHAYGCILSNQTLGKKDQRFNKKREASHLLANKGFADRMNDRHII